MLAYLHLLWLIVRESFLHPLTYSAIVWDDKAGEWHVSRDRP